MDRINAQVSGPLDYRVGEANNQLGSGGFNRPVADPYSYNSANLFVTGNVAGGRSFRAFSPIQSPYSLSTNRSTFGVSTSVLDDFRRDSVGLDDVLAGRTPAVISPYYSRMQTATSLGTLQAGFNNAGSRTSDGFYSVPTPTRHISSTRFGEPFAPELDWARINTYTPGRVTGHYAAEPVPDPHWDGRRLRPQPGLAVRPHGVALVDASGGRHAAHHRPRPAAACRGD